METHRIETLPAPVLPVPPESKWRKEQQAFRRLHAELLKNYRGRYVAIHEEQVVEDGTDKLAVAGRAYGRFGYVPIYVGLVTDQALPLTRIPSPRVLRPEKSQ
jgi:hypothetical protein